MDRWLSSIHSDTTEGFVSNTLPSFDENVKVRIRLQKDSPITNIFIRRLCNGGENLIEMRKNEIRGDFMYYEADVVANEPVIMYHFYILTKDTIYYYTQAGITTYIPDTDHDFKLLVNHNKPVWATGAVFYQIFCDRFYNGNEANDVTDNEYTFDGHPTIKYKDWNTVPYEYHKGFCLDFYGGDLEGIKTKIPYLKDLGVTAIYLNPIFYAATNHKYDCLDYFTVDPHFGGDEALAELTKALHDNNMQLILDVSINHTGTAHKWFNKEGTFFDKSIGAYNNKNVKERSYYFFNEDNSYKAWFDVPTLPTLNYTSKELKEELFNGDNSLVKKWLKAPYCTDGWRFDVADVMAKNDKIQLDKEVWPLINKAIKGTNPQAYILSEDWDDCTEHLQGDQWDSAMNYYGCGRPVREFAGDIDLFNSRNNILKKHPYKMTAPDLAGRINNYLTRIPDTIKDVTFNLFDSHDTPRLHNNPKISEGAYEGAVKLLFALPGAVNIYYGDEIGIDGTIDSNEGCRYPMNWNKASKKDCKEYRLYSTLAKLKKESPALNRGAYSIPYAKGYIFSMLRFLNDDAYLLVWSRENASKEITIPLDIIDSLSIKGESLEDVLGERIEASISNREMTITIPSDKAYLIKL